MSPDTISKFIPADVLATLRTHRRRWLLPALVIGVLGTLYAIGHGNNWEASQALIVRDDASTALDRTGKFQHVDDMKTVQETILELAMSKTVLEAALMQVGPPSGREVEGWPTANDLTTLQENLKLSPPKGAEFGKTEVFYLKVQASDRERAAKLANAICDQVQVRFQDLREAKVRGVNVELSHAMTLAQAELDTATHRLTTIEQEVGGDLAELRMLQESPSGESQLRRTSAEMDSELRQFRSTQRVDQELLKLLAASQADTGNLLAAPTQLLESQPALKRLKEGLVDAQLRTAQLQGTMSNTHPQVKASLSTETEIKRQLHDELALAVRGVEMDLRLTSDRIQFLEGQLANSRARMSHLATVRADYANAVSEVQHRTDIVKTAEQELAEGRASQAAAHSASLISRVDGPEVGGEPVGPSRASIALGSILGGLATGIGLLFLSLRPATSFAPLSAETASGVSPFAGDRTSVATAGGGMSVKQALQKLTTSPTWN